MAAMLIAADEPIPCFSGDSRVNLTTNAGFFDISNTPAKHKPPWTKYPPHKGAKDFQQEPPYKSPPPPKEAGNGRITVNDRMLPLLKLSYYVPDRHQPFFVMLSFD